MLTKLGLHNRFRLLFLLAVMTSVLVSSVLSLNLWGRGLLDATAMNMLAMAEEYEIALQRDPQAPEPKREFTQIYLHWESVPTTIKQLFPLAQHEAFQLMDHGFSMYEEATPDTVLTFLLPYPLSDTETLYVYSQFKPHPSVYANEGVLYASIELVALFNVCLILLLAFGIERQLLKPIKALLAMAERVKQRQVTGQLPAITQDNEFGAIAKPLQDSLDIIRDYHLREKQFLETASHELRTSIAVTRSALDIIALRLSRGKSDIQSSLEQIKSANKDMTAMTETLLQLAKAPEHESSKDNIDLAIIINELIPEHRYLLAEEQCNVVTHFDHDCSALAEPVYARIAIANLLRNAFENTLEGSIEVKASKGFIQVVNTVSNQTATRQSQQQSPLKKRHYGYGLGLEIIARFAEKEGWMLNIEESDNHFKVSIQFS